MTATRAKARKSTTPAKRAPAKRAPAPAPAAPAPEAPSPIPTQSALCSCGCGSATKGGQYLPGHDARHASAVAAEIVAGADPHQAVTVLSPRLAVKALRQAGLA